MRKLIVIFLLFPAKFVSAQDCNNPLVEYEKLPPEKIEEAYTLESDKHRLGRIVQYIYYPSGNLHKETGYENIKGKLSFYWEDACQYNDDDKLIHEYRYTEIPSCQDPELIEYEYFYPSDKLTIIAKKVNENETDSTFIRTSKNDLGQVILKTEVVKKYTKSRTKVSRVDITQYFYNSAGKMTKKIETDEKGEVSETEYIYEGNQIKQYTYRSDSYQSVKTYEKGLLKVDDFGYTGSPKRKKVYDYDKKGKEQRVWLYEEGKHIYSYVTSYNEQGLKSKYDMINESDRSSGIWLFEYDDSGRLIYKIDLYGREPDKKEK